MSMDDFWRCTPWQFFAAVRGWNAAHGVKKAEAPSKSEVDAMLEEHGFK